MNDEHDKYAINIWLRGQTFKVTANRTDNTVWIETFTTDQDDTPSARLALPLDLMPMLAHELPRLVESVVAPSK